MSADGIAPNPTGSGNRAIRWGLLDGLIRCHVDVGFYVAAAPGRHAADFDSANAHFSQNGARFWLDQPGPVVSSDSVAALSNALKTFQPDLVLAYGLEPLRLVRATGFVGLVGVMSIDLEHIGGLHRYVYNLRFGRAKQRLKSLLQTPLVVATALQLRYEMGRDYPKADLVVNHAANHANWHRAHHGRPTLYTPNPMAPVSGGLCQDVPKTPARFLLVGGIGGIATLTGLAWFAKRVYPLIEAAIAGGEIEVYLVGRGQLEPSLDKLMPRVVRRGYVDDLKEEMRGVTALLVPTPIPLGFRTRILDAFRHRVTVVAHRANSAGMPELEHGRNALLAATPDEFASAMMQLRQAPADAVQLARAAYEQFEAGLNGAATAQRILEFSHEVLAKRTND